VSLLGVDFGRRRIGLARAAAKVRLAMPWCTLQVRGRQDALDQLVELVRDAGFDAIVVGVPLSAEAAETEASLRVRRFGRVLEARTGVRVDYQDEYASTREAQVRARRGRHEVDAIAAAGILDDYMQRVYRDLNAAPGAEAGSEGGERGA
jgi:putative Holliday junction resolvase